jgi:hypothetical protein
LLFLATASFAQERIFLHEQIRFSSENNNKNMYLIPLLYRISTTSNHVSLSRLYYAFQSVITKHSVLRTALYFDTDGTIIQECLDISAMIDDKKSYGFSVKNLRDEDSETSEVVKKILNKPDLFDLSKGRVIHCHILRHCSSNDNTSLQHGDLLTSDDLILFTIHHAVFDGSSRSVFIRDLSLAYETISSISTNNSTFQYIDYSVHERIMDTTSPREFWQSELEGYDLECSLSLPRDRSYSSTDQRSGLASKTQIIFDEQICTSFLNYASSHHLTLFQLGLATLYAFLFKLTHGQNDLCIASINANRYRSELQNMIGMFVSTLPYRIQLDPHWSFDELVKRIGEKCLAILEHSHYPLQHILGDHRHNQSNVSFLDTMFDFITISENVNHLCLNGANLEEVSMEGSHGVAKFDFSLIFFYKSAADNNRLSCSFICSRDLFDNTTVAQIAERFQYLFEQLFQTKSSNTLSTDSSSPINKLSLILPEEAEEIQGLIFHRLANIANAGILIYC